MGGKNLYWESLKELNLTTLKQRRDNLSVKFARKCLKSKNTKDIFKRSKAKQRMTLRSKDYSKVKHSRTNRMKNLAIMNMNKQLNNHIQKKYKLLNV